MEKRSSLDKYRLIRPILEKEISIVQVSKDRGISVRTLSYWIKRFTESGLIGLERIKRKDIGIPRLLSSELKDLIQAFALQKPRLSISAIHRKIIVITEKRSIPTPSYATIYSIVKDINPALLSLSHEGSKAYQQKYELIYRRECDSPNEIWQCDHTQLDIYLIDSYGNERKPWVTTIIDDYSRAIIGLYLSFDAPSSINTALALRQAIWRKDNPVWLVCGIPQILYTDHGRDFMSEHIEQVCISLKIRLINSAIGRPQGRGKIERFFGSLNERVLIGLPGHTIKGKSVSKPSLNIKDLEKILMEFILNYYHVNNHSATGIPPIEKWENNFLPQMPESTQILDLLLLTVHKPRKIQRDGIRVHGLRYIAPTLAGFVGETVTIRYDPRDLAEITVYYNDKYLCKAICQDMTDMVLSLKEIKAARGSVKKNLKEQIKDAKLLLKKTIHKEIVINDSSLPKKEKLTSNNNTSPMPLKLYENE